VPRAWGYIVIVAAVLIGVGALLLPLPESVEFTQPEPQRATGPEIPSVPKPSRRQPRPSGETKPAPPKPPAKAIPLQDTTKSRLLVQPRPKRPG
jgi:hypothetical protein